MPRLFKHCTRQIYFYYIFIQRYTFYLLIFRWTDTKLIVNLELQEKFKQLKKKPESFMKMRAKISAVRASSGAGAYSMVALINMFCPTDAALIGGLRLIEGGTYSSKYGIAIGFKECKCLQLTNPSWILYVKKKIEFFMYLCIFRVKKTFSVYGVICLFMIECGLFSYRL